MQKNLRKWLCGAVALVTLGVLGLTSLPVRAEGDKAIEPRTTSEEAQEEKVEGTFAIDSDDDDSAILKLGKNLFVVGNVLRESTQTNSLLFVAGNTLDLTTGSEYGFVAGNTIKFAGKAQKDLFIAGNDIKIEQSAEVGRDVFAAGNHITVSTNLKGDLSATGSSVTLEGGEIAGNLNLYADRIVFKRDLKVTGKLVYNEDATVTGLDHVHYGELEVYEVEEDTVPLVTIWYAKLMSVVALFIVMVVIIAIWKHVPAQIAKTDNLNAVAYRLVVGLGALLLFPILAVLALMSYVLAPIGLLLLAVYIIMIYLAQGFAGLWLGRLILVKGFKIRTNSFAEAFVGILILGICALVPYLSALTGLFGLLLGLGLIIDCVRGKDRSAEIAEAETVKPSNSSKTKAARKSNKAGEQKD